MRLLCVLCAKRIWCTAKNWLEWPVFFHLTEALKSNWRSHCEWAPFNGWWALLAGRAITASCCCCCFASFPLMRQFLFRSQTNHPLGFLSPALQTITLLTTTHMSCSSSIPQWQCNVFYQLQWKPMEPQSWGPLCSLLAFMQLQRRQFKTRNSSNRCSAGPIGIFGFSPEMQVCFLLPPLNNCGGF